jgi:hypothetical protein
VVVGAAPDLSRAEIAQNIGRFELPQKAAILPHFSRKLPLGRLRAL